VNGECQAGTCRCGANPPCRPGDFCIEGSCTQIVFP
jgi:hypothetical protein